MKLHPAWLAGIVYLWTLITCFINRRLRFIPDLIRKSREINDGMSYYIAIDFLKFLVSHSIDIGNTKIIILGFSFKPNCPDTRNTKIFDLYNHLIKIGLQCEIFDPLVNHEDVRQAYSVDLVKKVTSTNAVALLAVEHEQFNESFLKQFTHVRKK